MNIDMDGTMVALFGEGNQGDFIFFFFAQRLLQPTTQIQYQFFSCVLKFMFIFRWATSFLPHK